MQAVPLAQTVFKVEADSLHLTLVGRFLYDIMHFVTEAKEIASVLSAPSPPAASGGQPEQPADSYRPITEVRNNGYVPRGCCVEKDIACTRMQWKVCGCCYPVQTQWPSQRALASLCSSPQPSCVYVTVGFSECWHVFSVSSHVSRDVKWASNVRFSMCAGGTDKPASGHPQVLLVPRDVHIKLCTGTAAVACS